MKNYDYLKLARQLLNKNIQPIQDQKDKNLIKIINKSSGSPMKEKLKKKTNSIYLSKKIINFFVYF